ncbi:hypothetical protein [Pseudomonas sp. GWSMS-1]|uniref:Uncharacterized protein n=1 Tax=viral metagenome TaxID=1070528 RepID=A0A6M3LWY2_9ZZZZ|nr:hypothetical protein [Gammaproteobacteria bacterium]MBU0882669.1 hypothetical protein [Gammaproteobacteria bacterium]MBU1861996.1 hypothetical protein [Gammaproteobacteria bacterium]
MHALPLDHATLVSIAEEASLKVGKNAAVASELVFPLVYLTLKKPLANPSRLSQRRAHWRPCMPRVLRSTIA